MPIPQWSSGYALGHPQIDAEHERLLELLGWLEAELLLERDMDRGKVKALVHELNRHVEEHFFHEEALMEGLVAMPAATLQAHRDDHQRWRRQLLEHLAPLQRAGTDLERRAHLARILLIGKQFWDQHVSTFDRAIRGFLRAEA